MRPLQIGGEVHLFLSGRPASWQTLMTLQNESFSSVLQQHAAILWWKVPLALYHGLRLCHWLLFPPVHVLSRGCSLLPHIAPPSSPLPSFPVPCGPSLPHHLFNFKVAGAPATDSEAILRRGGGGAARRAAEREGGEQPPAAALGPKPSAASGGSHRSQSAARDHTAHQREPGTPLRTCNKKEN